MSMVPRDGCDTMTFIKNIWYVAAWASELEADKPIGRAVIGEPIVLWHDSEGHLIAMEDRCPHRHAPLSMGRTRGDEIQCMYHGLTFSKEGRCVRVPGTETIPPNTVVRQFPVVVRDDWVWVWLGDPDLADEDKIPQAFGLDNETYKGFPGSHIDYEANYELVNDNLTDLAHLDFVHETTLGAMTGRIWSEDAPRVRQIEGGLQIERWLMNSIDPQPGQPETWNEYRYMLPGFFLQEVFMYPPGTAERCSFERPPEDIQPVFARFDQQAVTPISETRTRYFFSAGVRRQFLGGGPPADEVLKTVNAAFAEDHAMIEGQQRIWNLTDPATPKAFIPNDKAPSLFRKMIARRLELEAGS